MIISLGGAISGMNQSLKGNRSLVNKRTPYQNCKKRLNVRASAAISGNQFTLEEMKAFKENLRAKTKKQAKKKQ
ncbi:MAG: hypothetical protein HRT71_13960 [Flavobacteriales bacterium]|nr:hypothetical protein [Flavobacteriales bacterium]